MGQSVTGVDIGASGIRAVRLGLRDGQLELLAGAATDLPMRNGSVPAGPERPAGARREPEPAEESPDRLREIRTNLASLLRQGPFRTGRSVTGLGGSSGLVRYLQIPPVPPWKLEMMMRYEVEEQSSAQERSAFDYRILELPDIGGQATVMLAMVQERRLRTLMDTSARAGLPRGDVDLNALGLFNAYVHGHGADENRTVLLVDLGAETVNIVVARGSAFCFGRSVPGGGARFTAAVAEATGLTIEEAEKLKREKGSVPAADAAGSDDLPDVHRNISSALAHELGVLAGVLESSLMYCRAQTKQAKLRPDEVLLTGGGAMLPGLAEGLARRMRIRVGRLEPFKKVSLGSLEAAEVEKLSAEASRYAVALGLAASRLVSRSTSFSMVPEDVKARRRFLESNLWMWYASACVLLACALLVWVAVRNERMLAAEQERIAGLTEAAKKDFAEFRTTCNLAQQRQDEVKALEERVHSGRDVVQVLSLLRKATGERFEQSVVIAETGNRPPVVAKPKPNELNQVLQKARRVYVRGYASVKVAGAAGDLGSEAAAAQKAANLVDDYIDELLRKGRELRIVSEVVDRLVDEPSKDLLEKQGIARREFVLELVLAEPAAPSDRRLAAGGDKP